MPSKVKKDVSHRRQLKNKCSFVRFLVIVLSFVSLLSRIIYCTFATWLTITTFDCHPCPNLTLTNTSTPLFMSHHSSALFKSVRGLNVESKDVDIKSRRKRSDVLKITSDKSSQSIIAFNDSVFNHTNQTMAEVPNKTLDVLDFDISIDGHNRTNSSGNSSNLGPNLPFIEVFEDSKKRKRDTYVIPLRESNPIRDPKRLSNETHFENFTYIPSTELLGDSHHSNGSNASVSHSNESSEWHEWTHEEEDDNPSNAITMTILLDGRFNASNASPERVDPKRTMNDLNDDQMVNDTEYVTKSSAGYPDLSKGPIEVCSEDCSQFLSIELNDPSMRKWASIVITGVLYVYAFVMFSIFMGSCLALVDVLVIATFIEGAKLFAGFILIIIDSFNGRGVEFNLIDIRFNVNDGGNGWSADFSYSEYLLDIIIFFLSAFLCIRVFKCFEKKPKKVSSIEELVDTRGTYRPNPSRNDLEPIFEH